MIHGKDDPYQFEEVEIAEPTGDEVKEGKFPVDKIITTYPFEKLEQAREDSNSGKVIKAVVTMA